MRILMVSPYPPLRDGIASYAVQMASYLRRQGNDVEVLSPGPSAAHHHLQLAGPRGGLALAKRVRGYDRIIVQYHPAFFYDSDSFVRRTAVDLALATAFASAHEVEVWMHEVEYSEFESDPGRRRAALAMWKRVDRLYFHTPVERERFLDLFPVDPRRALLGEHGSTFQRNTTSDRDEARRSLGIEKDEFVFLAIGFIQRHKGFDRAVAAFNGLDQHGARLDVVGSCRLDEPSFVAYLDELREMTDRTPGAYLHEGYVSDERFDRWIVAADAVVLPYREIWSSGVMERAALYGRRVIATRVGGLAEQASTHEATLVDDDAALRLAMWAAVGAEPELAKAPKWADVADTLWDEVQSTVRQRAAARRGTQLPPGGARRASLLPAAEPGSVAISAPVRRLPAAALPAPTSARFGVSFIKQLVRQLTAWQINPLVHEMNALRQATADSLQRVEERLAGEPGDQPLQAVWSDGTPPEH